jgi:hypothetical protein
MQTGMSITVDASAQNPIEIQSDDPRNLKKLTSRIALLNVQSASDTKYDPKPPNRVDKNGNEVSEAFAAKLEITDTKIHGALLYTTAAISAIILIVIIFSYIDPKVYLSITQTKNGLRYLGLASIISLLSMGVSYHGLKTNETIQWYPALKYPQY